MDFFREKKHRVLISVLAAITAAGIISVLPCQGERKIPYMAWWGTLYPGFCFSEIPEDETEKVSESGQEHPQEVQIRTSFWLAELIKKVMDENCCNTGSDLL